MRPVMTASTTMSYLNKPLVALSLLTACGLAQASAAAPISLAFNAAAVSDYRYRGISQTRLKPALQGGVDLSMDNGFYAGAWGSTLRWVKDSGGKGNIELDLYAGYKGSIGQGLAYDLGLLRYQYPRNQLAINANTNELYAALSWGPATLKVSRSLSNLFGAADSKGSGYVELSASFDLGHGLTLTPHIGHQAVRRNSALSYTDWSLSLSKDLGSGFSASITAHDTDTKAYVGARHKDLGKAGLVLGLKAVF